MNFRENLRFALDSRGLLIKELSAKTGISENTIKTYLKADGAEPTITKALKIARALDVSIDFLATGCTSKKTEFEKELISKPRKNPKIAEIESLLPKCTKGQLTTILSLEKEFTK